jgi:hypothetical protein
MCWSRSAFRDGRRRAVKNSRIDVQSADLLAIVRELRRTLKERNWPEVFREGLSVTEINALQVRLGKRLSPSLAAVYQFCDGWSEPGLVPQFRLLPLQSVVEESRRRRYHWLVLLGNGAGEYLYVSDKSQEGPIRLHSELEHVHGMPIYDSLRSLLGTALLAHINDALCLEEHRVDMPGGNHYNVRITAVRDSPRWPSIYRMLNPASAWEV